MKAVAFEVEGTMMKFEVKFRANDTNVPTGVLEIKNIGNITDKKKMYEKGQVKYNYAWRRLPKNVEEALNAAYYGNLKLNIKK